MMTSNQERLLIGCEKANVCGYRVTRFNNDKIEEKLFAESLDHDMFESEWREVKSYFATKFNKCDSIPNDAEFIGYYKIKEAPSRI